MLDELQQYEMQNDSTFNLSKMNTEGLIVNNEINEEIIADKQLDDSDDESNI